MDRMCQMIAVLLISAVLTACHDQSSIEEPERNKDAIASSELDAEQGEGVSLTKLVAQPGGIYSDGHTATELSEKAKQLVGRYYLRMSCEDPLALCSKGGADFIVNLLEDGRVRRTIVYLGNVSPIDDRQYRQDQWSYDDTSNTIIIHLPEGADLYIRINEKKNLVIDRERSLNASQQNYEFFSKNGLPLEDYEFQKIN